LSVKVIESDHSTEHLRRFGVERDDLVAGNTEEATVGSEAEAARASKTH
jgi:hypothetical protein